MLWRPFWRPYWIFGVRKSSKWVHIYTIVFGDPKNIQIDTKFIVIDILQVNLWAVNCLNSHFGGHLEFLKTLNDAIFASFRSWIYGSHRFRIHQEQLCGLHFSLFQFSCRLYVGLLGESFGQWAISNNGFLSDSLYEKKIWEDLVFNNALPKSLTIAQVACLNAKPKLHNGMVYRQFIKIPVVLIDATNYVYKCITT